MRRRRLRLIAEPSSRVPTVMLLVLVPVSSPLAWPESDRRVGPRMLRRTLVLWQRGAAEA